MDSEAKVLERVAHFNDLLAEGYSQAEAARMVDSTIPNLHPDDRQLRAETPRRTYSSPQITEYGTLVELTGEDVGPMCHTGFST